MENMLVLYEDVKHWASNPEIREMQEVLNQNALARYTMLGQKGVYLKQVNVNQLSVTLQTELQKMVKAAAANFVEPFNERLVQEVRNLCEKWTKSSMGLYTYESGWQETMVMLADANLNNEKKIANALR